MNQLSEFHTGHLKLSSEIAFLKQEITFLLKLLSKAYSEKQRANDIKIMDAYWKEFEAYRGKLKELSETIIVKEKELKNAFLLDKQGILNNERGEEELFFRLADIQKGLNTLKQSYYDFVLKSQQYA